MKLTDKLKLAASLMLGSTPKGIDFGEPGVYRPYTPPITSKPGNTGVPAARRAKKKARRAKKYRYCG